MNKPADDVIDPILAEVRRNREALSARFNHDLKKMMDSMNEAAKKSGRKILSLSPRRPSKMPPAA